MENYSDTTPSTPEGSSDKDGKKIKKSAESVAPLLGRQEHKTEAAEKIAATETLWQRLVGQDQKSGDKETDDKQKNRDQVEVEGEINLSEEQAKEIALEHIEDRQEAVANELRQSEPGTAKATVAAADALLLERDQAHLADNAETLREALDQAEQETVQTLTESDNMNEAVAAKASKEAESTPEAAGAAPLQEPASSETLPPIFTPYEHEQQVAAASPQTEVVTATTEMTKPVEAATAPIMARSMVGSPFSTAPRAGREAQPDSSTERWFWPFKRKTERVVKRIKSEIAAQEKHIRTLATEQYAARRRPVEQAQLPAQEAMLVVPPVRTAEVAPSTQTSEAAFAGPQREVITQPPAATRETAAPRGASPRAERLSESAPELAHKPDELNDRETLAWAEKIVIDGASVRSVFEANRISRTGMEHVVHEYLQGGNVQRVLAQEMLNKELSYERDPILREHFAGSALEGAVGGAAFSPLQAQATSAASASAQTSSASSSQPQGQQGRSSLSNAPRQLAVAAWATLVVVLAVVAIILLASK